MEWEEKPLSAVLATKTRSFPQPPRAIGWVLGRLTEIRSLRNQGKTPGKDAYLGTLVMQLINISTHGGPFRSAWKDGGVFWHPILRSLGVILM
eukprot:6893552-Pyramimonas_sp.AAC.1